MADLARPLEVLAALVIAFGVLDGGTDTFANALAVLR